MLFFLVVPGKTVLGIDYICFHASHPGPKKRYISQSSFLCSLDFNFKLIT